MLMRDEKEERSKQGHPNNKAKQHSTPNIHMYIYVYVSVYYKLTRSKKKYLKMESHWFIIPLFHLSHDTGSHSEPPSQPQLHTQVRAHLGPIHTPVLQRVRLATQDDLSQLSKQEVSDSLTHDHWTDEPDLLCHPCQVLAGTLYTHVGSQEGIITSDI